MDLYASGLRHGYRNIMPILEVTSIACIFHKEGQFLQSASELRPAAFCSMSSRDYTLNKILTFCTLLTEISYVVRRHINAKFHFITWLKRDIIQLFCVSNPHAQTNYAHCLNVGINTLGILYINVLARQQYIQQWIQHITHIIIYVYTENNHLEKYNSLGT
jgi:hypothetical protein